MLIEDLHYKQIDHYRKSQDHKLQGDLYAEIGYKLKDTLDKEKAIASAVNPESKP